MNIANELYFSPGVKFSEIQWENKGALIEAFEARVKGFYLDPAKKLNDEKYAFATGVLCVSTIDLLACITISCNSRTVGTRFKQWIKENITAFDNSNPYSEILADKFYYEFRNGLVHEGRIKNVGQFSYDKEELVMYLFIGEEIPGKDNEKLLQYINHFYGIDWDGTPTIKKIKGGSTISVSTEKNHFSIELVSGTNKAILKITEKNIEKFMETLCLKKESGNPKIWKLIFLVNPKYLLDEVTYLKKYKGEIEYANSC